ncbi:MAG: PDZ domain-containing protein [Planctomycetes bacterium]|nr:PDZ domain-containing protein [Planctomycetota bacterium]
MGAIVAIIFSLATGARIEQADLIRELATHDVVFVGEEHDNRAGHDAELALLKGLHDARKDVVLSLEMIERDCQGTLNDWLAGRIADTQLAANARLWPNHPTDYAPLLAYAREHKLDVIASNVPRPMAKVVSDAGATAVAGLLYAPRRTSADADRYRERFYEQMKEHMGAMGSERTARFYEAQCVKDDAMAESIADWLAAHPARKPLVLHVAGRFHVEEGLGTVSRLIARRPLVRTAVVLLPSVEQPEAAKATDFTGQAHFVWVCAKNPAKAEAEPEAQEDKPRAGLGIMPDYAAGEEPGVLIGSVTPEGAAEKAGLRAGDRLLAIDGKRIENIQAYMAVLGASKPGQKVSLLIEREIVELTIPATLGVSQRR